MGFKKLNPNDLLLEEQAKKKESLEDYVIPTAQNYVLESLEEIEAIYRDHAPTKSKARVFHLVGHIRYLRNLLESEGIAYSKREAIVHDLYVS